MKKYLCFSAVLLAVTAGHAMAADGNVDVKVTGQIVPPACVPVVSGGAISACY